MSWAIVVDSSCNLRGYQPTAPDTTFALAPLKINVGGEEFVDDEQLDVANLNRRVAAEKGASSSACPSAGEWSKLFELADNVIAITISANLSASYESAMMAKQMVAEKAPRNIHIVNSRAAGGKLEILAILLDRYLTNNPDCTFVDACAYIDDIEANSTVLFSLSSYENLTKSGRMPKMAGALANRLSIRVLGIASDEGTIKIIAPARSQKKMFAKIIDQMDACGYSGGMVAIDHVENEGSAQELADLIKARWSEAEVVIMPCGGLCSYYAESNGLIIGFGWSAAC